MSRGPARQGALARYLRLRLRSRSRRWETVALAIALVTTTGAVLVAVSPWLADTRSLGLADWDFETAQRALVRIALRRYHELPLWNPYACGGFPAWGYIEGATTFVSPWLPHYLGLAMPAALRVEVLGMGLLGALGAFAFAGLFTRSYAARALVVALWAVNGRWALQIATGHTWHLAYAWLPWCLFFYERARTKPRRPGYVIALGAGFALILYAGGMYPLPHTFVALGVYASALAVLTRSARPLLPLATGGLLGLTLSAPKLLPMLATFAAAPRAVESNESIGLATFFHLLTARAPGVGTRALGLPYGWHEYGMYVSLPGACLVLVGLALVRDKRLAALAAAGLVLLVLGFGAFSPAAPWTLVHAHIPFLRSQHVPTRFLYPAALLLAVAACAALGRWLQGRPRLDAVAAVCAMALAFDVAWVARGALAPAMRLHVPPGERDAVFHFEEKATEGYDYTYLKGSYVAMLRNRGVIDCYGLPDFGPRGARSTTDPRYRGEAYVDDPDDLATGATARVTDWSPNHAEVHLEGAAAGSFVVYNMNYAPGWESDVGPVVPREDKVAVRLSVPSATVTFRYRPPNGLAGLLLGGIGVAACAGLVVRDRRRRRAGA
jgi:hypothetical protein